jgi:transcriptional regulator with XRE-family HTH domain
MEMGLSQNELGEKLGVSFQQIQKYEKGVNRVSSSSLIKIADVLKTTTSQLLDSHGDTTPSAYGEFMMTREGPMLLEAMIAIDDVALRRVVVTLARELANLD